MKVLVACEYSGRVREAFTAKGHFAVSCDLEPTDIPGYHHHGDVMEILYDGWDLLIGHPPCTYLTLAGARWYYHPDDKELPTDQRRPHPNYPDRWKHFEEACEFFNVLKNAPIDKICLENSQPLGIAMDRIGRYTQKVQPWMFGSENTKGACLWLKNLPELVTTHEKPEKVVAKCHMESPGPDRWKRRSTTDQFIANAMAEQWG